MSASHLADAHWKILVLEGNALECARFGQSHRYFDDALFAALIDKDRKPKWSPAGADLVSKASVDAYLEDLGEAELKLPRLPGFAAP